MCVNEFFDLELKIVAMGWEGGVDKYRCRWCQGRHL